MKLPKLKGSKIEDKKSKDKKSKDKKSKEPKGGKLRIKKPKKRTVLLFLVILLGLFALAKVGILKGFLPGTTGDEKKTEAVQKEQSRQTEKNETDVAGNIEGHLGTEFIKTLKSDQYMIKYKTTTVYEGKSYEVETTYTVSGNNISLASGDRATIVKDGKVYMLNHTDKTILSWDVAHSGDLKRIDTEGLTYTDSRQEGSLVCEEYKTPTTSIKLYFEGEKLVRMATVINKLDTVMDIIEVSKKMPSSLFVVPEDYSTTNI